VKKHLFNNLLVKNFPWDLGGVKEIFSKIICVLEKQKKKRAWAEGAANALFYALLVNNFNPCFFP
jgi:hypothetical protein